MKKLLFLICTLLFTVSGVRAAEVTDVASAGTPLTLDQLKALSGTGAHVAFANLGSSPWTNKWLTNPSSSSNLTLSTLQLYTLTAGTVDGKFFLQRVSDGQYRTNGGFGDLKDAENVEFTAYSGGISVSCNNPICIRNNSGTVWNINYGSFGGAVNGWAAYAAYGPYYLVHKVVKDDLDNILDEATVICTNGTQFTAPEMLGYNLVSGEASITVNDADIEWTLVYQAASTVDYTVSLSYENDVVVPVTVTVRGEDVTTSLAYSGNPITESDVTAVVTDPTYYATTVTISGTTINVYCYDPRWPINFPKTQTYTRSDRHLDGITFESSVVGNQSATGFYNNGTSTLCYQDLTNDATRTITFPAETEVHPNIARTGGWEHGFVYIDLDNNGSFADEGELVSKVNEGNPSLSKDMPNFVMPSTPGTYRMRVKMDWASEDPGGNPGPSNYIIDNGGAIVDLSLVITAPITTTTVTYKVVDEGGSEVWASDPIEVAVGETISTLPDGMKRPYTSYTDGAPITTVEDASQNVFTTTATFNLPFKTFTDYADATWYKATIRSSYYVKYDSDTEPYIPVTTYEDADNYKWAFQGNPYTGIAVYNKATGESKTLTTDENGTWNSATKPIAVMRDGVFRWNIKVSGYSESGFVLVDPTRENYYVNQNGTAYLGFWVNSAAINDNGSTWRLEEILSADAQLVADLTAAIATLSNMNTGSGYGQYGFAGTYADYNGMESTIIPGVISAAQTALDGGNTAAMTTQLENLQGVLANLALNMPKNGSAFRIKSTHGTYLPGTITGNRYIFQNDADASTIWFLKNGMLYNYTTGEAFKGRGDATTVTEFGIEAATGEEGKYVVRFHPGNNTRRWLWAWNPDHATNANKADQNGSEAANTRFTLEAVTTIPVTVSDALHATLFLPVGVQAVEGMTLNAVRSKGNDYLTLESVEKIAANTPVVVKAEAAGTYNLPVVTDGVTVEGNLLTGVAIGGETIDAEVNAYILGKDELGVGFFLLSSTDRALKSFKAYYVPASETSARAFYFDDVTGLNKVLNTTEGAIYDLSGRRVEKAQKGLYIVNGKKVLVK